jgi:hypothetical protein
MDMSFKEKSTWGLLLGIVAVSIYFFPRALHAVDIAQNSGPLIGLSIAGVIALIIFQIIYHSVIAATARGVMEADERDKLIDLKAERLAGFALGFTLFWIIGRIIITTVRPDFPEPSVLTVAIWLLAALTASEIVKLLAVIAHYRIGS